MFRSRAYFDKQSVASPRRVTSCERYAAGTLYTRINLRRGMVHYAFTV